LRTSWKQSPQSGPGSSLSISASRFQNSQQPLGFDRRTLDPKGYNDDAIVRDAISAAIKGCSLSRIEIAEQMTLLLGIRVTEKMLNSYSGESNQTYRWPAAWDRAFCIITADDTLLVCRVLAAGLHVLTPQEYELLELGREYLRQQRANERVSLLEKRLAGVEL